MSRSLLRLAYSLKKTREKNVVLGNNKGAPAVGTATADPGKAWQCSCKLHLQRQSAESTHNQPFLSLVHLWVKKEYLQVLSKLLHLIRCHKEKCKELEPPGCVSRGKTIVGHIGEKSTPIRREKP